MICFSDCAPSFINVDLLNSILHNRPAAAPAAPRNDVPNLHDKLGVGMAQHT